MVFRPVCVSVASIAMLADEVPVLLSAVAAVPYCNKACMCHHGMVTQLYCNDIVVSLHRSRPGHACICATSLDRHC